MLPNLRKRISSEPVVIADYSAPHGNVGLSPIQQPKPASPITTTIAGALKRIMGGVFGTPNPASYSASFQVVVPKSGAFYQYHEGDVFTPGTQNYVFEPTTELPLQTIWGRSFLRKPNQFNPLQPPQVYSNPNIVINGIGGLVAGQFAFQPLETDGQ